MSWTKNYHYYFVFGDISNEIKPWMRDVWIQIQPLFEKILKSSPHFKETALETEQFYPKPNTQYFDTMKFGKLTWNEQSHRKWNLPNANDKRLFDTLSSWTPRRTVCGKLNSAPDIFFSISNESLTYKEKAQFGFLISIAVVDSLDLDAKHEVIEISKLLQARQAVYTQRQWNGKKEIGPPTAWEFINSIQDTIVAFGIYKAGATLNIHDTKFEDLKFEPFWKIIYSR